MRLAVLFVSSCFLCFGVDPSAELLFADSSKASRVDVRVTACDIAVEGTDSGKITVTLEKKIHKKWESSEPPRARISGDALVVDGGCRETKRLLISVPRSYPYRVRMAAGNVTVSGMESSGDVSLVAGHISIGVARPELYRQVQASVTVGHLDARLFHASKGGFFRSMNWSGKGTRHLRASVTTGHVELYGDELSQKARLR